MHYRSSQSTTPESIATQKTLGMRWARAVVDRIRLALKVLAPLERTQSSTVDTTVGYNSTATSVWNIVCDSLRSNWKKSVNSPSRVLLAHRDEGGREIIEAILHALGHTILATVSTYDRLVEEGLKGGADVIITSVEIEGGDGIDALLKIAETHHVPAVVVAKHNQLDRIEKALEDHVMAYLVEPVNEDELRPTIYLVRRRFEQFQALREENETLKESLEARKVVERAKGRLMERYDLTEEEAYQRLQRTASNNRKRLREVAEAVLIADELDGKTEN